MLVAVFVAVLAWAAPPDVPDPFDHDERSRTPPGAREDGNPPPPSSLAPILRRRSRGTGVEGPEPLHDPDDALGDRAVDRVRVDIRADGSAKVDVPSPLYLRGVICAAGVCVGNRGVKRQSKKPVGVSTAPVLFGIAGTFGYAPASTNHARAYLAQTREQRLRQAVGWQRRLLANAAGEMSVRLGALLHDESLTAKRRHAIVFDLWDEAACAAENPETGDSVERERVASAAQTRAKIERFVARWLPRGTTAGYSEGELARLNARRCSVAPFRPYAAARDDSTSQPAR